MVENVPLYLTQDRRLRKVLLSILDDSYCRFDLRDEAADADEVDMVAALMRASHHHTLDIDHASLVEEASQKRDDEEALQADVRTCVMVVQTRRRRRERVMKR